MFLKVFNLYFMFILATCMKQHKFNHEQIYDVPTPIHQLFDYQLFKHLQQNNDPSIIIYKDNLLNALWYYGNMTTKQYKNHVFRKSSLNNLTNCPENKPFANESNLSKSCLACNSQDKPLFNLEKRQCQQCPKQGCQSLNSSHTEKKQDIVPKNQTNISLTSKPESTNQKLNNSNQTFVSNNNLTNNLEPKSQNSSTSEGENEFMQRPTSQNQFMIKEQNKSNLTQVNNSLSNDSLIENNDSKITNKTLQNNQSLHSSNKTNVEQNAKANNTQNSIKNSNATKNNSNETTVNPSNTTKNNSNETTVNFSNPTKNNSNETTVNPSNPTKNNSNETTVNPSNPTKNNSNINLSNTTKNDGNESKMSNESNIVINNSNPIMSNSSTINSTVDQNLTKKQIQNCTQQTPFYNPLTQKCENCPTSQQYNALIENCIAILYKTDPNSPRLIVPNTSYLDQYNKNKQNKNPTRTLQFCLKQNPYLKGQFCIKCQTEQYYNVLSESCVTGCLKAQVYDSELKQCIVAEYLTNPNANNLATSINNYQEWKNNIEKQKNGSINKIYCPETYPYEKQGQCIKCDKDEKIYYQINLKHCIHCQIGKQYNAELHSCKGYYNSKATIQRMIINIF